MAITTSDCKRAIVQWIKNNPGFVSNEFDPPVSEAPALIEKNWKRMWKQKEDGLIERGFDCKPYDDQLRAYTWDNGNKIVKLNVQGE